MLLKGLGGAEPLKRCLGVELRLLIKEGLREEWFSFDI